MFETVGGWVVVVALSVAFFWLSDGVRVWLVFGVFGGALWARLVWLVLVLLVFNFVVWCWKCWRSTKKQGVKI